MRLVPTSRSARSSWLGVPGELLHTTNIRAPAYIRTHSTLGPTIIAHDLSVCFLSFMHSLPRYSHYPRISRHARRFSSFFVRVPTLFLAGLSFLLFASRCAGRSLFLLTPRCAVRHTCPQAKTRLLSRAMPARKQKHARSALASAHADDRRTDEATCGDRKSTRLNSSHVVLSRMPSSA